jgi:nucleoside-diphosphate-sugar epimerase
VTHLAFVVLRGRMSPQRMFEVNVNGSMRLMRAARAAGVRRLVHLSSAAVYGSGAHLDEGAPLVPLPGFLYGEHKALLETLIAAELPDCVVLRPHAILGPNAQPLLRALVRRPLYVKLPDPQPVLQCVHEEDVADAVLLALARPVRGAFNLAVEENFTGREIARSRHRMSVALPLPAARAAARVAWKLFGWGGEPAWVNGMSQSLTLNCRRALVELGWRRRHDLAATLADA